jgi:hypothetical protein
MTFPSLTPPKCMLVNLTTNETQSCLFNPTQFVERVAVNWGRAGVLGLSHQPLQYQSTGNRQLPGVEFYLDRFFAAAAPGNRDIDDFRSFLRALTVPPTPVVGAPMAPPRTLVLWPRVITIETVITDLEFGYRQFAADASVLVYAATVTFEEILDVRVTSEMRRSGA